MNVFLLKMNRQSDLTQSRQDRNHPQPFAVPVAQSGDARSFQNWRQHVASPMEEQAAEEKEARRQLYGPWSPAETPAWEDREEAAALRAHMERVRDGFRLEEETTIRNLQAEQAEARQYKASLMEAESAIGTRQREAAESQALNRALLFFLSLFSKYFSYGYFVCVFYQKKRRLKVMCN